VTETSHRESSVRLGEILAIPWLLPGIGASLLMAYLLGGPVQRTLRTGPLLRWVLIVSLGIILSATLTPAREALAFGAVSTGSCDLSRVGFAPLRELLRLGDTSLNVLLFVPLGVSIAFLPRSRLKVVVAVAAIALPFAIETTQLLVLWLDRACQSADVVDNLTGLAIGLGGGVVAGRLAAAAVRQPR
jgi:glycopeptide antibiotics resistance protein